MLRRINRLKYIISFMIFLLFIFVGCTNGPSEEIISENLSSDKVHNIENNSEVNLTVENKNETIDPNPKYKVLRLSDIPYSEYYDVIESNYWDLELIAARNDSRMGELESLREGGYIEGYQVEYITKDDFDYLYNLKTVKIMTIGNTVSRYNDSELVNMRIDETEKALRGIETVKILEGRQFGNRTIYSHGISLFPSYRADIAIDNYKINVYIQGISGDLNLTDLYPYIEILVNRIKSSEKVEPPAVTYNESQNFSFSYSKREKIIISDYESELPEISYDEFLMKAEINIKDDLVENNIQEGKRFIEWKVSEFPYRIRGGYLYNIGGKVAYIEEKQRYSSQGKYTLVYDDQEIGTYQSIGAIHEINGKLAYNAEVDNKNYIYYDGQLMRIYESNGRVFGSEMAEIDGKLAYSVSNGSKDYMVYDGNEGNNYLFINCPTDVDGKLAYLASNSYFIIGDMFVVYDGKSEPSYPNVECPINLNGKLTYSVDIGNEDFLVYDGYKVNLEYDGIERFKSIGGVPVFVANRDNETFIVYKDQELGKQYDNVWLPLDAGGKPLYYARKDGTKFFVYNGIEIGAKYDKISKPVYINGEIAYIAELQNKSFIVYNRQEIGKEYEKITGIQNINGKLVYTAEERDPDRMYYNSYIVREK